MFSIYRRYENGFEKIVLVDNAMQTSVEVLPNCGAILHSFSVINNGKIINVIDNYLDANDFEKNLTTKGFKSCKLSPFACRLHEAKFNFENKDFTIQKFLLGKHALHGLIYDCKFNVIEMITNETYARLVLQYNYLGTDAGFPFNFECIISYELHKENTLKLETKIVNKSKQNIPIQDGWHPYITFGNIINDLYLEFNSKNMVLVDEQLIPTGKMIPYDNYSVFKKIDETQFDTCFQLNFENCQPKCILKDINQKIGVEIIPEKSYPYLQLYTPTHRQSIAIENLSAPPNCFNNGIDCIKLAPNEHANFNTIYKIKLF